MNLFQPPSEWVAPTEYPNLSGAKEIAIDLETRDPGLEKMGPGWPMRNGEIIGIAVAVEGGQWYFPIAHSMGPNLDKRMTLGWLKEMCSDPYATYIFHNAQYDLGWLSTEGIYPAGRIVDTMVAAPLLDENRFSYSLNNLLKDYLGESKSERDLREAAKEFGLNPKSQMHMLPAIYVGKYAEQDAGGTLRLWQHLRRMLDEEALNDVFQLECDLIPVLHAMRARGVRVDTEAAARSGKLLEQQEKRLLHEVKAETGIDVEIWAAASIAKVFDKLSLPYARTEKTQAPSFTKAFLKEHPHPVAKAIVQVRELNKARTTFIDTIMSHNHMGRIHCEFHQLRSDDGGTVTGRFCVHGDTVLELDTGPVRIGEYEPTGKERIQTHTGKWQRVIRRIYKGKEEMFSLQVSSGHSIKCTGNHRVLTPTGWRSVKDLSLGDEVLHVPMQETPSRSRAKETCGANLSVGRQTFDFGNSAAVRSELPHRRSHCEAGSNLGTVSARNFPALFAFQIWRKEPYARKVARAASQLQRTLGRWSERLRAGAASGVVYGLARLQAYLRTRDCYVPAFESYGTAGWDCCSPHRREQTEQRSEQFGRRYGKWAPQAALRVTVTKKDPVGIAQVWDIEVETDHSYVAHGLIHHNSCSNPNLQQIPARDPLIGPMIRGLFLPEEGMQWGAFDYSSQEPRLVAHYAYLLELPGAEAFHTAYQKDPNTDFHQIAADLVGVDRKKAKNINLGLFYGMGKGKLADQLGLPMTEANELFAQYHAAVPFVRRLSEHCMSRAEQKGVIRTLLGRKCHFNKWEPRRYQGGPPKSHSDALAEYGPEIKRAFTYKALNKLIQGSAADQTKKAMLELFRAGILPMLQLHDELDVSITSKEEGEKVMEIMETCVQLSVPSVVDMDIGPSWGEAKTVFSDRPWSRGLSGGNSKQSTAGEK